MTPYRKSRPSAATKRPRSRRRLVRPESGPRSGSDRTDARPPEHRHVGIPRTIRARPRSRLDAGARPIASLVIASSEPGCSLAATGSGTIGTDLEPGDVHDVGGGRRRNPGLPSQKFQARPLFSVRTSHPRSKRCRSPLARYVRTGRTTESGLFPEPRSGAVINDDGASERPWRVSRLPQRAGLWLRDGDLISIRDVGAPCRCTCPACGGDLIAHKGSILVHHFAHAGSGDSCGAGLETSAHLWAKLALETHLWIRLPALVGEGGGLSRTAHRRKDFQFARAELEKRAGEIIPDVQLTAPDERRLVVEVLVTHACGPEKIERIRARAVSAVEVDLSDWKTCEDAKEIARALLTQAPRVWFFNPTLDRVGAAPAEEAAARARAKEARRLEAGKREVARIRRVPLRR